MAVNPIIECIWRDLVPKYCQGLESSAIYTVPPIVVEYVHGSSNKSLPQVPLHMHAEDIIPTFLTWNIYIGISLPKALTLTQLQAYKMFEVLLIVRINKSVGLQVILNFRLQRNMFLRRLARGVALKAWVLYALQSMVRTPPPHFRWTLLALQISLNTWLPPHPLYSDSQ